MFFFLVTGETKLRSRAATIKQLWTGDDRTIAELEVDFTPDEIAAWKFSPTQRHARLATHPVSGAWTRR